MKGIYVLLLRLNNDTCIRIGKLGELHFKKGWYAYAGSALGQGGFKRVIRHFNVASGKNPSRKWHIDYILPHSNGLCAVLLPTGESLECTAARSIGAFFKEIPGFGCSDCACRSHLFYSETDFKDKVVDMCNKLTGIESIIINPHI